MKPLITLKNITKRYGGEDSPVVLKGIDMEIFPRDFLALMGASGSGKTTLMNIIGLLDTPTSGNYYIDNEDVSQMDDGSLSVMRNRRIGFIFQSFYLIPYLNVLDNVLLPRFYSGGDMHEGRKKAMILLEEFGMADKYKSYPRELSGGQQQRVAIARALAAKPAIILADEPTGNLDSRTSQDVLGLMKVTSQKYSQTIVMITHNEEIAQLADRTVRIEDGKIVGAGR
jgi:putative ABC transport system ATP-binding protein